MPSLISNYRKHAVVNKLKTDISLIQNAVRMAEVKHGLANEWSFPSECLNGAYTKECSQYIFETYLAPELQILEKCYPVSDKCWISTQSLDGTEGYLIKDVNREKHVAAVLKNGSALYLWTGGTVAEDNLHMQMWIDIDGPKKGKNMLGADIFGIGINFSNYTTVNLCGAGNPDNFTNVQHGCSKNSKGLWAGRYCAGLIQYNGWKIPEDYPIKF